MIKQLLKEGFILKSQGYYKHAIESFYKALEYDNTSAELFLEIADCYKLLGDEERAINYIEKILDKNPTHIGSLKLLKNIFIDKKAWAEAEQSAKNIYCISNNEEDLVELLSLLNKQEKYKDVLDFQTESTNCNILYERAYAEFMIGNFENAKNIIDNILSTDANNTKYQILKGKILYSLNDKDNCIKLIKEMNLDKENDELLNFVGLIEQYQGHLKTALDCFLEAIKTAPKKDEYYYNCASTYFKMGDIALAKKYYNLAISLNPENTNYHFALANLYYSERYYKRALEELYFDTFESRLLKSIILYDTGYMALARKEFQNLAEESPENPIVIKYNNMIKENLEI